MKHRETLKRNLLAFKSLLTDIEKQLEADEMANEGPLARLREFNRQCEDYLASLDASAEDEGSGESP